MNTPSASSLFANTDSHTNTTHTFINPCLWFVDCDGYRVICYRQEILYRVALLDSLHLALVAVTLRQSGLATQADIAAAFGHAVATQRRWETRYRQHGSAGLQPNTPTGRHAKLPRSQRAFVERWFQQGVSNREMAKRLAVGEATIRRVLQQAGLHRQTTPIAGLPFDDDPTLVVPPTTPVPASRATPTLATSAGVPPLTFQPAATLSNPGVAATACDREPATQAAVPLPASNTPATLFTLDSDPTDRSLDRALARQGLLDDAAPLFGDHAALARAGVLLVVPVLQAHGGLEVFNRLYASLGPAFYGLRTTIVSLILLALLRIKRPENLKEYAPQPLGCLLGLDRMAEVKTLRRKLTLLAERCV